MLTVDTVEVAAPVTLAVAGVNIIGWLAFVVAVITLTFCAVVAVPVTFPVRFPENDPLNVVAATVPVDGFTVTVETEEVAAPETVPVAGVNVIGCVALVVAATTVRLFAVVAVPVKFPAKVVAVKVSVLGLYVN